MLLKPGTTVMITSKLSPAPYVPGGLYTIKGSNLVQLTMRNTDICPLTLQKKQTHYGNHRPSPRPGLLQRSSTTERCNTDVFPITGDKKKHT
jgi:hypothetical protein